MPSRRHGRALLVAAEGLDASGKSRTIELLGRWLERRGRRVKFFAWRRARAVVRAAGDPRRRPALTPRVASLLTAAEALRRVDDDVRPALDRGDVVLADRYAWTGVAREIARGVDPAWASTLYRPAPPPDLVIVHRHHPEGALSAALASRPPSLATEAVAAPFAAFLADLAAAYETLLAGAHDGSTGPWPVPTVVVEAVTAREDPQIREARRAVADLLDADGA